MLENAGKCCHVCQILINICNMFDNFRQFQYSNAVLNIKCTVADGYSNGNAHGPSRNDFTSPFYFLSIFTIRIIFAIFLEVSMIFSFQKGKRKRKMKKEENVYH